MSGGPPSRSRSTLSGSSTTSTTPTRARLAPEATDRPSDSRCKHHGRISSSHWPDQLSPQVGQATKGTPSIRKADRPRPQLRVTRRVRVPFFAHISHLIDRSLRSSIPCDANSLDDGCDALPRGSLLPLDLAGRSPRRESHARLCVCVYDQSGSRRQDTRECARWWNAPLR